MPAEKVKLVLNRADSRIGITPEDVHAVTGRPADGLIPSHRDVARASSEARPIVTSQPASQPAKALRSLADSYLGTREQASGARSCDCWEGTLMELAQRLTSAYEPQAARDPDPFWELKDRVHKAVIGGLGPRLFNTETDPATLRDRVRADVAGHLESESGLARATETGSSGAGGRHSRTRPAGAAPIRRHHHGDHGERAQRGLDRAAGSSIGPRCRSWTIPIFGGSS